MSRKRPRHGGGARPPAPTESDYFDLYASIDIHEVRPTTIRFAAPMAGARPDRSRQEMILDAARVGAYQAAMEACRDLFQGKIVLDVGCGMSCILTLLALKAGAAHVIAVDAAPGATQIAAKVLADNRVRDRVTLLSGRIEDIAGLPGTDHVDVIVSEWMGYALLFESMLESVLIARDRWLAPGGVLFPSRARLHLAPFSAGGYVDTMLGPWSRPMYGDLDLSALGRLLTRRLDDPQIMGLDQEQVLGRSCCLRTLDLPTLAADRRRLQQVDAAFDLEIAAHDAWHGLCLWFEVEFPGGAVRLGTSPSDPGTHWKQTLFFLDRDGVQVDQDDRIRGSVQIEPNPESHRLLDVAIRAELVRRSGERRSIQKSFTLC